MESEHHHQKNGDKFDIKDLKAVKVQIVKGSATSDLPEIKREFESPELIAPSRKPDEGKTPIFARPELMGSKKYSRSHSELKGRSRSPSDEKKAHTAHPELSAAKKYLRNIDEIRDHSRSPSGERRTHIVTGPVFHGPKTALRSCRDYPRLPQLPSGECSFGRGGRGIEQVGREGPWMCSHSSPFIQHSPYMPTSPFMPASPFMQSSPYMSTLPFMPVPPPFMQTSPHMHPSSQSGRPLSLRMRTSRPKQEAQHSPKQKKRASSAPPFTGSTHVGYNMAVVKRKKILDRGEMLSDRQVGNSLPASMGMPYNFPLQEDEVDRYSKTVADRLRHFKGFKRRKLQKNIDDLLFEAFPLDF